jgi:hypothetical protein
LVILNAMYGGVDTSRRCLIRIKNNLYDGFYAWGYDHRGDEFECGM